MDRLHPAFQAVKRIGKFTIENGEGLKIALRMAAGHASRHAHPSLR